MAWLRKCDELPSRSPAISPKVMGVPRQEGYLQFLGMARGSNLELQTQLVLARRLLMGDPQKTDQTESLSTEVAKMLISLMKQVGETAVSR